MPSQLVTARDFSAADVARLSAALCSDGLDPLVALFEAVGAQAPLVLWRPGPANLRHPVLRRLHDAVAAQSDARGRAPLSLVDSDEFKALSDYAMVLEPVAEGRDFRYVQYGNQIANSYRQDLTGRLTSEIGGHIALFFLALYQAVMRREVTVKSVHEPPEQVFVQKWQRLLVPLFDASGAVRRIAAVNVPDNDLRAGLDALPDPVLVVGANTQVVFGNRAACRMFGAGGMAQPRGRLQDVLGTQVDLGASPESLVRQGTLHERRQALLRDHLLVPVRLTVGATFYRQTPFYVVTVQPQG
jgi:PAS domain-containing protein